MPLNPNIILSHLDRKTKRWFEDPGHVKEATYTVWYADGLHTFFKEILGNVLAVQMEGMKTMTSVVLATSVMVIHPECLGFESTQPRSVSH